MSAIKLNGSMTAETLGKELGISPVAVRQHLTALEAEGHIVTSVERRGLGRPVHKYTLTLQGDETFPRAYDALANALLEELRFSQGDEAVDTLFAQRRERQLATHRIRMEGKSLAGRVAELAKIQSEGGYMALSYEADEGFLLTEHNCAVCQIARHYPAACHNEIVLFQELLGEEAAIERTQHLMAGDHACTYWIRAKSTLKRAGNERE
jgi:predicted ArsR family transcriptional regulator